MDGHTHFLYLMSSNYTSFAMDIIITGESPNT